MWTLRCSLLVLVAASIAFAGVRPVSLDPQALLSQVVQSEIEARTNDSKYWRYLSQSHEAGDSRTEVIIETPGWTLKRLIARSGRLLTAKQFQEEDRRILDLVHDPHQLDKEREEDRSDSQRILNLLRMLPDAALCTLDSTDGNTVRLRFYPRPGFHPPTSESRVFRVLEGSILVDAGQKRLTEIRGHLSRDLDFGWGGIFGKLREGSFIEVRQEQVEPRLWAISFFNIQVTGRAWFFKTIGTQRKESHFDFRRVPDGLTLEAAAEMARVAVREFESNQSRSLNRITPESAVRRRGSNNGEYALPLLRQTIISQFSIVNGHLLFADSGNHRVSGTTLANDN